MTVLALGDIPVCSGRFPCSCCSPSSSKTSAFVIISAHSNRITWHQHPLDVIYVRLFACWCTLVPLKVSEDARVFPCAAAVCNSSPARSLRGTPQMFRCFCLENKQNRDGFIQGRGSVKIRAGPFLDPSDELRAKVNPAGSTGRPCQLHPPHLGFTPCSSQGSSRLPGGLPGPQVKTSGRQEWKERREKHEKNSQRDSFLHTVPDVCRVWPRAPKSVAKARTCTLAP